MQKKSDYLEFKKEMTARLREVSDFKEASRALVQILKSRVARYDWVGIYLLEGNLLKLLAYEGAPSPHEVIPLHSGICGAAASSGATLIIDDVNSDSRYLACSIQTKSEIVVPIFLPDTKEVIGEIDIDSHELSAFSDLDQELLESLAQELALKWS